MGLRTDSLYFSPKYIYTHLPLFSLGANSSLSCFLYYSEDTFLPPLPTHWEFLLSEYFLLFCMPSAWLIVDGQWNLNGLSPESRDMSLYSSKCLWRGQKLNKAWPRRKKRRMRNLKSELTMNSIRFRDDSGAASTVMARSPDCSLHMHMHLCFQVFASILLSPGMQKALPLLLSLSHPTYVWKHNFPHALSVLMSHLIK